MAVRACTQKGAAVRPAGLKDHKFVWQYTYRDALLTFRDAALRYAHRIKVLHATRTYSTLPETTPLEARERYPNIL